jgi:NAD dependent epimerase/dehydratase family
VFGEFRYKSNSLGKVVSSPFSILVKVVDGKVTYSQFLEDSYATAASFRKHGSWVVQTEEFLKQGGYAAMDVALTGATGFTGSHVLAELQAHGHEVLALVPDDDRRYHALRRRQPQNRRAFVVEGRRTWCGSRDDDRQSRLGSHGRARCGGIGRPRLCGVTIHVSPRVRAATVCQASGSHQRRGAISSCIFCGP